jgi:hypothetical protein
MAGLLLSEVLFSDAGFENVFWHECLGPGLPAQFATDTLQHNKLAQGASVDFRAMGRLGVKDRVERGLGDGN